MEKRCFASEFRLIFFVSGLFLRSESLNSGRREEAVCNENSIRD